MAASPKNLLVLLALSGLVACGGDSEEPAAGDDAGPMADSGQTDAGPGPSGGDAGGMDSGGPLVPGPGPGTPDAGPGGGGMIDGGLLDPPTFALPSPCPRHVPPEIVHRCFVVQLAQIPGSGTPFTVNLSVLVVAARSGAMDTVPVAIFNGGPGASTFDLGELLLSAGEAVANDHDLVFMSERGTFGAVPLLDCPELAVVDELFDESAATRDKARLGAIRTCRTRLSAQGINPEAFTNSLRAGDVPEVMKAIGYERYHVFGISGGAMLAQRLVRDQPEGLLSITVDGGGFPVPHMSSVWKDVISNVSDRFGRLFDECAADTGCNAAYPNLEMVLNGVVDRLNATPVSRPVMHPGLNQSRDVQVTGDRVLRLLANSFGRVATLPKLIHDLNAGDFSGLDAALAESVLEDNGLSFADGVYYSVTCADAGNLTIGDVTPTGARQRVVEALLPTVQHTLDRCKIWYMPPAPAGNSVTSDKIPVLLFEGLYDSNKRPELADTVAQNFSVAHVVKFPTKAHVTFDQCAGSIMAKFLADPSMAPDTACVPKTVEWVTPAPAPAPAP